MTITIGSNTYNNVDYDEGGDVLYLHKGDPRTAVDFSETPEGHALRFAANGELVGLTIIGPRRLLEKHGFIKLTLPVREEHVDLTPDSPSKALVAA